MVQSDILRVGDWDDDEDYPIFPGGSQPKKGLICPVDLIAPFVIPGHHYIFKTPEGWHSHQIWSELIVYEIARLINIDVPRCLIARDGQGKVGALLEFFYNYPGSNSVQRLVHGSELLMRSIQNKKKGRPHGIRTNVQLARRYRVGNSSVIWGAMLAFDALIGNTDRHPDNWGILWRYTEGFLPKTDLAPAFDNGTSLGCELPEPAIQRRWTDAQIERYVSKGRHHCGWSPADDARGGHMALCRRFLESYPEASDAMKSVIRFSEGSVRQIVDGCVSLGGPNPMTDARAQFVCDLIRVRRMLLVSALES